MNNMFLVLFFSIFSASMSLECFKACYDCTETGACSDHCGFEPNTFPGYVPVSCTKENDKCVWLEYFQQRITGERRFSFTSPFGCLEDLFSEENAYLGTGLGFAKFNEGLSVFTCDGDFCNTPPQDTGCSVQEARNYLQMERSPSSTSLFRQSPCFLTGFEFEQLRDNVVRFGDLTSGGQNDLTRRCINKTDDQISAIGLDYFTMDYNRSILDQREILTCDLCQVIEDCELLQDTPAPTSPQSFFPTSSPINSPTQTTISPSLSPNNPEDTPSPTSFPSNTEGTTSEDASPDFERIIGAGFVALSIGLCILGIVLLKIAQEGPRNIGNPQSMLGKTGDLQIAELANPVSQTPVINMMSMGSSSEYSGSDESINVKRLSENTFDGLSMIDDL